MIGIPSGLRFMEKWPDVILGSLSPYKQLTKNSTEDRHELYRPLNREYDDALIRLYSPHVDTARGQSREQACCPKHSSGGTYPQCCNWVRTYTDDVFMDPFARVLEIG